MSHKRIEHDNYPTPPELAEWAVKTALEIYHEGKLPAQGSQDASVSLLEPGCGDEQPFAAQAAQRGCQAFGYDIRPVIPQDGVHVVTGQDFLTEAPQVRYDVIATNPPYKYALQFLKRSLDLLEPHGVLCFLTRVGFLASQRRYDFFQERPPYRVYILAKRPSFTGGGTDSQEYCFAFWLGDYRRKFKMPGAEEMPPTLSWVDNRERKVSE